MNRRNSVGRPKVPPNPKTRAAPAQDRHYGTPHTRPRNAALERQISTHFPAFLFGSVFRLGGNVRKPVLIGSAAHLAPTLLH